MLAPDVLDRIREFVVAQADRFRERAQQVRLKPGAGLVTELDEAIEQTFRSFLAEVTPHAQVVGEEQGGQASGLTWWLDPLDGTTNYVHGWPRSAISLALYDGVTPLWALVRDPYLQETFEGLRGQGARCNGRPMSVGGCQQLSQALLGTGFAELPLSQWQLCQRLHAASHGVRVSGCAALDLAYVACGRLDGFWEVDLKPWDVAAGLLLLQETGAQARDFAGQEAGLFSADYVVGNRAVVELLLVEIGL